MRSIINSSGILATALCGVLLVGCNAVEDVREEPFTPVPTATVVLSGTITGLGTKRGVELQNNGANPKRYFATRGASVTPLDFGVLSGSNFNITVKSQPFAKICTVANGTGTAGAAGTPDIVVTCVPDPAVPRFPLTVTIPAAVSGLSNLKLTLETEDGIQSVDATGLSTYTFQNALFNSLLNVPAFQYKVSATTDTTSGSVTTANNCLLTSATPSGRPGMNITTADNVVTPTAAATVAITACSFTVAGSIAYSTPPGGTAQTVGAMTLALKDGLGVLVPGQTVTTAAGATTFTFPAPLLSNSHAIYDLVVTSHPAGQYCTVSGTTATTVFSTIVSGLGSAITAPTAGGVLLLDPVVPDWWAFAGRNVRCRALPVLANQLTGTYQTDRLAPVGTATTGIRPREFLTFFADGTFLYGLNFTGPSLALPIPFVGSNPFAASGVIHGFYNYNPAGTGTIAFTVLTATNTSPLNYSLVGMPGYSFGTVTATNVVKTPATLNRISLTFTGRIPAPAPTVGATYSENLPAPTPGDPIATTNVTKVWNMTEPDSIEGEMTGTWVSDDHRRMVAYNKDEVFLFHAGVNGVGNLQDGCLLIDDASTQSAGLLARHGASTFNCAPGGQFRAPDLPNWTITGTTVFSPTVIRIPTELNLGRFPGTKVQLDNRPTSPVVFSVVDNVGTPDTWTVQNTLNGELIEQPVTFKRYRVN